jgi:hypothetical protein
VIPGVGLTGDVLAKGYQLKQVTGVEAELWRMPERRVALNGGVFTQIGRIWSEPRHSFLKLQTDLRLHWFPLPGGDDYEMQHQIRMGKTWGDVPFDELFTLGVERDNDLQLRGHVGTHHGRKGSSPLGRCYFLSNWEVDKNVYRNPLLAVKLGPFVDTGKITDASAALGSHEWLWDIGAQAKVRVLGVGVALSYGKDLRSGGNAYYVSLLR